MWSITRRSRFVIVFHLQGELSRAGIILITQHVNAWVVVGCKLTTPAPAKQTLYAAFDAVAGQEILENLGLDGISGGVHKLQKALRCMPCSALLCLERALRAIRELPAAVACQHCYSSHPVGLGVI